MRTVKTPAEDIRGRKRSARTEHPTTGKPPTERQIIWFLRVSYPHRKTRRHILHPRLHPDLHPQHHLSRDEATAFRILCERIPSRTTPFHTRTQCTPPPIPTHAKSNLKTGTVYHLGWECQQSQPAPTCRTSEDWGVYTGGQQDAWHPRIKSPHTGGALTPAVPGLKAMKFVHHYHRHFKLQTKFGWLTTVQVLGCEYTFCSRPVHLFAVNLKA